MVTQKYIIRKKLNNSDSNGKISSYNYYYIKNDNKNNKEKISDRPTINRIKKIYIAPAYKDVKIFLNGDVLATGIDTAGRKQYVYSNSRRKKRETDKYDRLLKLSRNISNLKKHIKNNLNEKLYTKTKIIALILKIMDLCNFRCGNKKYEKKYGSYGLTTLHKKHFIIKKNEIIIDFIGKKGVQNYCSVKDTEIQNIIKHVYKISTKDDPYIFNIIDEKTGEKVIIDVRDINKYLEKFHVTSKDLRTWNANIIFLKHFKLEVRNLDKSYFEKTTEKQLNIRKGLVRDAIKNTAFELHNTPTVCKNSYIVKNIVENIIDGTIKIKDFEKKINPEDFVHLCT